MLKIKNNIPNYLLLISLLCVAADKPKLMKIKVTDAITVVIPKEWHAMEEDDIAQRFPSVRAPIAAFTDNARVADFSIKISATQWPDDDVTLAQQFFRAGIMNVFDRVEMINEGIHEVHGKKFIFFEFDSRVNGNRQKEGYADAVVRYTYIQYLIEPGKAIVFSFSCPARQKDSMQETARAMMKGVKVK